MPTMRPTSGQTQDGLLSQHLSESDLCGLAASCETLAAKEKDRALFRTRCSGVFIFYMRSGGRDELVKLLSTRFIQRLGWSWDAEFTLVKLGGRLKTNSGPWRSLLEV